MKEQFANLNKNGKKMGEKCEKWDWFKSINSRDSTTPARVNLADKSKATHFQR
jgi:hypothetical protein